MSKLNEILGQAKPAPKMLNAPQKASVDAASAAETAMTVVSKRKVEATYKWRPFENGPVASKTSVFDFTNCTEEQIMLLAMYGAKVKIQAALRDLANADPNRQIPTDTFKTVDVLNDVINTSRKAVDPKARAIAALRRLGVDAETITSITKKLSK
jgi:hypothetical protein